jgi:hypothetical protein
LTKQDGATLTVIGTGRANIEALAALAGSPIDRVPVIDPITAQSVIQGPHGRAWLCDEAEGIRQRGGRPEDHGSLGHWVIEAPWAHPAWHSYSLVLIHLRPMSDNRRTLFYIERATHELWLYAINPKSDRRALLANGIVNKCWLSPLNFAAQIVEVEDHLAIERVTRAIQEICDGKLSPDTDYRHQWIERFGNNMMKDRPGHRPPTV